MDNYCGWCISEDRQVSLYICCSRTWLVWNTLGQLLHLVHNIPGMDPIRRYVVKPYLRRGGQRSKHTLDMKPHLYWCWMRFRKERKRLKHLPQPGNSSKEKAENLDLSQSFVHTEATSKVSSEKSWWPCWYVECSHPHEEGRDKMLSLLCVSNQILAILQGFTHPYASGSHQTTWPKQKSHQICPRPRHRRAPSQSSKQQERDAAIILPLMLSPWATSAAIQRTWSPTPAAEPCKVHIEPVQKMWEGKFAGWHGGNVPLTHPTRSWSSKTRGPVLSQSAQPDTSPGSTISSMWCLTTAVHDPFEGLSRFQRGEQSALLLCHPAFPTHSFLGKLGASSVPLIGDESSNPQMILLLRTGPPLLLITHNLGWGLSVLKLWGYREGEWVHVWQMLCCQGGKTSPKDTEQNLEVKGNQLQNKIPFLFKATEIPATHCLQLVSLYSFNSNVF